MVRIIPSNSLEINNFLEKLENENKITLEEKEIYSNNNHFGKNSFLIKKDNISYDFCTYEILTGIVTVAIFKENQLETLDAIKQSFNSNIVLYSTYKEIMDYYGMIRLENPNHYIF